MVEVIRRNAGFWEGCVAGRTRLAARASTLAIALSLGWLSIAGAAESGADTKDVEVGELVVTAQKREQRLTDVPAAVSAVTGKRLEAERVQSLQQLDGKIPSFRFVRFNLSDAHLNIRGIGSSPDGAAIDRSVAIFIDDVYIGRAAAAASDIFDLERVEVLRGPQGTLYGKNVVGGAINYVTPTPDGTFGARIRAGVGNLGQYEAAGVISGGLLDNLAGSLSGSYRKRDGFVTNLSTGNKLEAFEAYTTRGALAYRHGDLRARLSIDYALSKGNGQGWFPNAVANGAAGISPALMVGITPRAMYVGPDGSQRVATGGISGKVDWDLGTGSVTSITAFRRSDSDISISLFGANVPRRPNGDVMAPQPFAQLNVIDEEADQFSQELRYLWESDRWTLLTGAFFMREEVYRYERTDTITAGTAERLNINDGRTQSTAVFADISFRPIEALELNAGVRYTRDNRKFGLYHDGTGSQYGQFPRPAPYITSLSHTWTAITPKASILYRMTPSINAYGLVSRGFKSGGFDGQPNNIPGLQPINSEFVWNYEGGVKGSALSGALYFELAAFQMDYTDLQATTTRILSTTPLTTATVLQNAAAAKSRGVEATLNAKLGGGFDLNATLSRLSTKITDSNTRTTIAIGNELGNAPHWSYSAGLGYSTEVTEGWEFGANLEFAHVGEAFSTAENVPQGVKSAYDVVNGRVRLTSDSGVEVILWGANLTNELYAAYQAAAPSVGGLAQYAPPRTFGITIGRKW